MKYSIGTVIAFSFVLVTTFVANGFGKFTKKEKKEKAKLLCERKVIEKTKVVGGAKTVQVEVKKESGDYYIVNGRVEMKDKDINSVGPEISEGPMECMVNWMDRAGRVVRIDFEGR